MKLAYICSPCRGDYEKNIIKAQEYCREAMNDGLLPLHYLRRSTRVSERLLRFIST